MEFDAHRFKKKRRLKFIYSLSRNRFFSPTLLKQLAKMDNEYQRYYVFVSWKNGRDAAKIHEELSKAEGERALLSQLDDGLLSSKTGKLALMTSLVLDALAKQ